MELHLFRDRSIDLYFDARGRLVTLFLYGPGHDGHLGYEAPMPFGLLFSDAAGDVRLKLGIPASRAGTLKDSNVQWERFDFERYCVHVEYGPAEVSIRMITVMAPSEAR